MLVIMLILALYIVSFNAMTRLQYRLAQNRISALSAEEMLEYALKKAERSIYYGKAQLGIKRTVITHKLYYQVHFLEFIPANLKFGEKNGYQVYRITAWLQADNGESIQRLEVHYAKKVA